MLSDISAPDEYSASAPHAAQQPPVAAGFDADARPGILSEEGLASERETTAVITRGGDMN